MSLPAMDRTVGGHARGFVLRLVPPAPPSSLFGVLSAIPLRGCTHSFLYSSTHTPAPRVTVREPTDPVGVAIRQTTSV